VGDSEFVRYFRNMVREVNGIPFIADPITERVTPITSGLKFNRYTVVSVGGDTATCLVKGKLRTYSLEYLEEAYSKSLEKKRIKNEKEKRWKELSYAVKKRDGFKCTRCGATKGEALQLHSHHIIPKSAGGEDTLDNLTTLCIECHIKAHAGTEKGEFLQKLLDSLKNK